MRSMDIVRRSRISFPIEHNLPTKRQLGNPATIPIVKSEK